MRKKFQQKANVPMGTETYKRLALELYMTGETLINQPSVEAYNQMSKMFAALARVGLAGPAMDLGNGALSQICDRFERVGKVGVKESEAEQLRLAITSIDDVLPRLPVNLLDKAIAEVEVFCAMVGA